MRHFWSHFSGLTIAMGHVLVAILLAPGCGSTPKAESSKSAAAFAFWPQFPDAPRIQFVRDISASTDVARQKDGLLEKLVFGKEDDRSQVINKPYGVAMRNGRVYVCDMRSAVLTVFDLRKKQTRLVGVSGVNALKHPVAVAVGDDGTIYVADNERGAIVVFDAAERYSRVLGHENFRPSAVAVHGDLLYATNTASHVVEVFDCRSGQQTGTIGSVGDGDGQFRLPLGVAVDGQGDVYVVDMMQCRVQKFDEHGTFISSFGKLGDYAGTFARPKHIAVDRDGIVYVVDASFQNVQMFDAQGRLLMHFGSAGTFPGAMNLPAGICVSEDGLDLVSDRVHPGFEARRLVLVTNQFGPSKVGVYALGGLREGFTAQQLAAAALPVDSGVGTPSAERLKMQTVEEEPGAPGGARDVPPEPGAPRPSPAAPPASPTPPR